MDNILVLDNGSYSIKAGFVSEQDCREFPNYVMKTKQTKMVYVSDLIDRTSDVSGLYFHSPFDKGYLVNWDTQLAIWDRLFEDSVLNCTPKETNLVLTEPIFNPPQIKSNTYEIIFEEYEFPSLLALPASDLVAKNSSSELFEGQRSIAPDCMLIVDIGQSFTFITPFIMGYAVKEAIKRIDIGGLLLTNLLKNIISYRTWDMMDESYIVNDVKEKCCFVSQDFIGDLKKYKLNTNDRGLFSSYVLPDFTSSKTGFVYDPNSSTKLTDQDQVLVLKNERVTVPETLFYPSDIGINQGGIHEAILESIEACPEKIRGLLASNIVVIGGTSHLPGLKSRLELELRKLLPASFSINVFIPPKNFAWRAGKELSSNLLQNENTKHLAAFLSRQEYQEMGSSRATSYFR